MAPILTRDTLASDNLCKEFLAPPETCRGEPGGDDGLDVLEESAQVELRLALVLPVT